MSVETMPFAKALSAGLRAAMCQRSSFAAGGANVPSPNTRISAKPASTSSFSYVSSA